MSPVAVVAGASGIVGFRIGQQLAREHWRVVGLSRKPLPAGARFPHLQVDLTNLDDCREKLAAVGGVTHVFYAARYDHAATPAEPIDVNLRMLENLIEVLDRRPRTLRHVHLVHGTKYYGAPYGRYKTPSRESDPRCFIDNFYFAQEDYIAARQKGERWNWSISRPQAVSDCVPHVARSIPWGLAVYATLCKARNLPLSFPSSVGAYQAIYQCTEATHLAKAIVWMATQKACANEAFNVTNGDYFRWENLWPRIADYFGVPIAPPRPMKLANVMAEHSDRWSSLAQRERLRARPYKDLVLWSYLDFALAPEYDRMSDVTKLRKFGFHDVIDTEEMFIRYFDSYRKQKMIPAQMRHNRQFKEQK